MRLATFNLYQYLEPPFYWYERKPANTYSVQGWQNKKAWIRAQIGALDADVIGFQEVFSGEDLQALMTELGYPHFVLGEAMEVPAADVDDQVMSYPRLAIASRYPIRDLTGVPAHHHAVSAMNLKPDFAFSRSPVAVTVEDPLIGPVRVLTTHLKSKRPLIDDVAYPETLPWEERALDAMTRTSRGMIASLLQRGAEAAMLYDYFAREAAREPDLPFIVLGDLNDDDRSIVINALTMAGGVYEIGEHSRNEWPSAIRGYLYDLQLYDGFGLSAAHRSELRPYTHVYRGHQDTLDYILLSNHFNEQNPDARYRVTDFAVLNAHLNSDGTGDRYQSDHGQVVVEVLPEASVLVDTGEDDASEYGMTRQAFVDLAGGIHQSSEQYSDWSGRDKYQAFWSFFFDEDFGWVKSTYGQVPVSELYQKQRYSIEHIIPQSFLKQYLASRGRPNAVRYGATVNPLNFVAAERQVNSTRSSFPFDMDGDTVERPFRLDLNPDAYGTTGLDHENEWVIPMITRGDIARSILYMVLTYEIDELYNRHVETLVHWAKVDPATPWEMAYNAWVQARLGIHNPLIDTPENALRLLENETLMRSAVLAG